MFIQFTSETEALNIKSTFSDKVIICSDRIKSMKFRVDRQNGIKYSNVFVSF